MDTPLDAILNQFEAEGADTWQERLDAARAELAALRAATRWVPVTERLPEDGRLVWTRTIALGYERERKYQALRLFSGRWYAQYDSLFLNTVDAWMPILTDPAAAGMEK